MRRRRAVALLAGMAASIAVGGCSYSRFDGRTGACARDPGGDGDCQGAAGLVAYSCTGTSRPDDEATYDDGIPSGIVCADGAETDGSQRFCCTGTRTTCAYDPVAACGDPFFAYQCRGADRPESLNPMLMCGQGWGEGDYIDYCCSRMMQPAGCLQSDAVTCSPQLVGWTCMGDSLPKGEELGASKSRADLYYQLCATPTQAPNPAYKNYCCYTPALVPEGSSCVQDTEVPGCAAGRFGFACYGRDKPGDSYLPMNCDVPGATGRSAEGYPATLYCCDFQFSGQ